MPNSITILDGINDGDDLDTSATSFAGSPSGVIGQVGASDTAPTTLYRSELEGIAAATDIFIDAGDSLHIDSTLSLQQNTGSTVDFATNTGSVITDPGAA